MECYSCGRKYIDWRTRIFLRRKKEYKIKILNVAPRGIKSERKKMNQMTVDHGYGVPAWVNLDDYILTSVDRREATHVLIHVEKGEESTRGDNIIIIGKEAIRVVTVRVGDLNVHYMKVNTDVNSIPEIVRQRISVAFSMINGYDYGDEDGTSTVIEMMRPEIKLVGQKQVETWPGEFEQSKITQAHHTHLNPKEISEVLKGDEFRKELMYDLLANIRKLKDPHESMVAGMMLYIATADECFATMFTYSKTIWEGVENVNELFERLKKLSTPMKGLQNGKWVDLTQLFELQTLVNRGVGGVDWNEEKRNREKANTAEVDPQEVYKAAREVFKMGKDHGFKYRRMNLDNYLRSRWEWAPTGSVHSQHEEDNKYIFKEYLHKNKFVTLCNMDIKHLRSMFSREPEIHAWTSTKYEWGKQRAIYGVDLTSTVITNFAMYACEEVFKHRFPVGEEAESERVHRRLVEMLKNKDCLCYDFDDFNSQHKYESMKAVLIAYKAEFEQDMTPEQKSAMNWVINSVDSVTVHCNETGEYKIKDTLLSGWRLTTFMNTVLNYAYFKAAGVFEIKGIKDSVHNGDDVCLAVDSLKSAIETYERMEEINARAQPLKCNLFSTGEFLRVDHKVKNKYGGAQYLSRACATAVHARTESNEPDRFRSGLAAIITRAKELEKRSEKAGQYVEELVMIQVRRLCEIFEVGEREAKIMMKQHIVNGGISTEKDADIDYIVTETVGSFDELKGTGTAEVRDLMPGIQDYAYRLFQMFKEKINIVGIISQIKAATRDQIAKGRYTKLEVKEDRLKTGEMKLRVFKKYKGMIRIPYADRARFLNISPMVLLPPDLTLIATRLIGEGVNILEEIKILF
ncbi:RNA-dependent RNA polymerase [Tea-oil camellia-associated totivirus 1]|uniref:RNA-directed RNA polymerase n=1 Tax=Tea-oil camellia-associated totivirus 1 TaxID=2829560 RepID=A0AAE7RAN8_9VIRU|nr:RNA-dependent RNA polymerase [Tea-oil camellia-associated totivirus 1]